MKKTTIALLFVGLLLLASPFATASEGSSHPETYLGIPAGILKFVNVVVFIFFLGWLLKTPISNAFKARGEKIKADLDEARQRQEKADSLAADIQARLDSIEKEVASIIEPPNGCPCHPRCQHAIGKCAEIAPQLTDCRGGRVSCHRAAELDLSY